jgi:superfamily II DNA or RNA helicase
MSELKGQLTQRGLVFDYDIFEKFVGPKSTEDLLNELTITKTKRISNKYTTRSEKCYKLIKSNDKRMITFARFTLDDIRAKITTSRTARNLNPAWSMQCTIPVGISIDPTKLLPGPTLDPNQEAAMNHLLTNVYDAEHEKRGSSSAVLVMGTGTGKSYMAAALVGKKGVKTLVIGPSDIVLKETRDALEKSYPNLSIGEYSGKTKNDGDVVLMIINSALSDEFVFTTKTRVPGQRKLEVQTTTYKWHQYFSQFGLVIYDEIHNYTSTTRQEIFWRTNFRFGLGLTATPDENSWDMDIIFQRHMGPLIRETEIAGYNPAQIVWQGSVIPIIYSGPDSHTQSLINPGTGWESHGKMCDQFASDPYRSQLIMTLLVQLWKEGRNVFVFARTREHVDRMADDLSKLMKIELHESKDAVALMGGASDDTIQDAKAASVIFTTYDYGWQGVSIPKMDTLVFATPRMAKMRQIRGRITRKSGDTTIPRRIYDIVDVQTKLGKTEFRERKKIFNEESNFKFEIAPEIKVKYDDIPSSF